MTSKRPLQPIRPRNGRPISGYIPDTPPPGSYNIPSTFDMKKSVTIKGRPKDRPNVWVSIGPGSYDQSYGTLGKSGPRFSMGSRTGSRFYSSSDTPAPGSYDQSFGSLGSSRRGFSLGSRFGSRSSSSTPGPGSYNIRNSIGLEGTRPTLKSRTKLRIHEQTPSPADYNIKGSIGTAPGATIKSRTFIKTTSMDSPGVGSYNIPSTLELHKGPIFGTSD